MPRNVSPLLLTQAHSIDLYGKLIATDTANHSNSSKVLILLRRLSQLYFGGRHPKASPRNVKLTAAPRFHDDGDAPGKASYQLSRRCRRQTIDSTILVPEHLRARDELGEFNSCGP